MPTLVTLLVLFSRKGNENSTTPGSPVGLYVEGAVDMEATGTFCLSSDDDRLVTDKLYYTGTVTLPAWLPVEEWAASPVKWKYLWGMGVDPELPETWQRGLLKMKDQARVMAVAKLLGTKKFRSEFRKSLRDRVVEWLETPVEARRYDSPLSQRQWDCLVTQRDRWAAENRATRLYWDRSYTGCPA